MLEILHTAANHCKDYILYTALLVSSTGDTYSVIKAGGVRSLGAARMDLIGDDVVHRKSATQGGPPVYTGDHALNWWSEWGSHVVICAKI